MFTKLKHLPYRILKARKSGLTKLPRDDRDYNVKVFGWGAYEPKHIKHIIPTITIKNQKRLSTCQWNATTVQKEVDEKIPLSVRSLVIAGKLMGYVGKKGLSNLRSGQMVLQKWGILSEATCPDINHDDWDKYLDFPVTNFADEASTHKIKSYWSVTSMNDVYKLLDENRVIVVGMDWFTGYNMSKGFTAPWIIRKAIGWLAGGHAFIVKGYNRETSEVLLVQQNSYGKDWGDGGDFYITEEHFIKNALNYGCYVNLDSDYVPDLDVLEGKKIFESIKERFVWILRPDSLGELYEINDEGLDYIPVFIGSSKLEQRLHKALRESGDFEGVSEQDFAKVKKYLLVEGKKIGQSINIKQKVEAMIANLLNK